MIWLVVAVLLAWAVWKLYPVIMRWLERPRPAAGTAQRGPVATLAEPSDLFEQAARRSARGCMPRRSGWHCWR